MSNRRSVRRERPASPEIREGSPDAAGLRFGIVCARWNPTVTDALLRSAVEALRRLGSRPSDVTVVRVPGAFELPLAASTLLRTGRFDALAILAAIIRGETSHHDVLAHAVSGALARLSAESGTPIGFGVLTCDTMEQARRRVRKGAEAVEAAAEMANLARLLAEK